MVSRGVRSGYLTPPVLSNAYITSKMLHGRQSVNLSLFTPVSSTNKSDCHDITEILLKVALNTITLTLILMRQGYLTPSNSNVFIFQCLQVSYFT